MELVQAGKLTVAAVDICQEVLTLELILFF
jgi:hypothetical protein